jgi:hypothetical protein
MYSLCKGDSIMTTHTPTPWRLLDNTGNGRNLVHVECEETLDPVCSIPKARIADAALIVRAVNGYGALERQNEAMYSALQAANSVLDCILNTDQMPMDEIDAALLSIRKALALTTLERSEKVK